MTASAAERFEQSKRCYAPKSLINQPFLRRVIVMRGGSYPLALPRCSVDLKAKHSFLTVSDAPEAYAFGASQLVHWKRTIRHSLREKCFSLCTDSGGKTIKFYFLLLQKNYARLFDRLIYQ